jgi:hypothetical protein
MEAGLAVMVTVAAGVVPPEVLREVLPPHPAKRRRSGKINTIATGEAKEGRDKWARDFIAVICSLDNGLKIRENQRQRKQLAGSAL